ncbi:MAG: glycosyltransferase [Clostridia bacterium]|nr:glycosyltransferase [Clostridia bacterium]
MHTDTEMLPTVCVLLSAYNGAQYLEEQIDSVLAQTGVNVFLDIRDDGSPEPAKDIYAKYAALPNVRIRYGENLKPTAAFWKLLEDADDYKYYAFCDQDDIWDSDKLVSAVNLLRAEDPDRYLIYCGANRQIDSEGNPLPENDPRYARLPVPPTVIERVLICRGTVQGCTMVINDRLRERVLRYKPDFQKSRDIMTGGSIAATSFLEENVFMIPCRIFPTAFMAATQV